MNRTEVFVDGRRVAWPRSWITVGELYELAGTGEWLYRVQAGSVVESAPLGFPDRSFSSDLVVGVAEPYNEFATLHFLRDPVAAHERRARGEHDLWRGVGVSPPSYLELEQLANTLVEKPTTACLRGDMHIWAEFAQQLRRRVSEEQREGEEEKGDVKVFYVDDLVEPTKRPKKRRRRQKGRRNARSGQEGE